MCNIDKHEKALRRSELAIIKAITYLTESVQYFWPGNLSKDGRYVSDISESNIALHLARAFSENNYQVWSEIPFSMNESGRKLDFMAYNCIEDEVVFIELKNNLDQKNKESSVENDYDRLLSIRDNGIKSNPSGLNYNMLSSDSTRIFGLITLLNDLAFNRLWNYGVNRMAGNRNNDNYIGLEQRLLCADARHVVPIIENGYKECDEGAKYSHYRYRSVAYALYKSESLKEVQS